MTKSRDQIKKEDRAETIAKELVITKAMAETFHFQLTYRIDSDGNNIVHRANCFFCERKFLATAIGMPINERMIQHFKNHHDRGRLQEAK